MAVCEIWDVKGRLDHPIDYAKNPEKTVNPKYTEADLQALGDVMKYATNGEKTEKQFFVTGVNCDPATARDEMMITKGQWQDESEIVCYHGYQSFKKGEVTPEQAHEVGVKLAERMWGDRFQVIVATHLNTDCLHNHFVLNSVSFADGKHYHDNKKNLRLLRKRSDELSREYALSVIEQPSGRKKPYALYQAEKQGLPTRDTVARQAVDEAISKSFTLKDFDRELLKMGYRINFDPNRKYWTIIGKGWQRPKRLYKLGELYLQNEDMVGWIAIDGTKLNYPVMQTKNNPNFYLKRNFEKEYSDLGVPYIQENCDILNSDNLIIYGHHIKGGKIFGALESYKSKSFYEKHKTIHFDTLTEQAEYEIVAVFKTVAYSAEGYRYYDFVNAETEEAFAEYVAKCKELALYDTGVSAEYGDKLITLSTCEYSAQNGRLVVVAKKVV